MRLLHINDQCPRHITPLVKHYKIQSRYWLEFTLTNSSHILPGLDHPFECCKPEIALIPVTSGKLHLFETESINARIQKKFTTLEQLKKRKEKIKE